MLPDGPLSRDPHHKRDEILTVIAVVSGFATTAGVVGYIAWLFIKAW